MVAVISYTGYDLEDSICINKMSRERGVMYGTIYKTKMIDLEDEARSLGYKGGMILGKIFKKFTKLMFIVRKLNFLIF
jgi:DNA-directed RNA polymerase I subunit RPA2